MADKVTRTDRLGRQSGPRRRWWSYSACPSDGRQGCQISQAGTGWHGASSLFSSLFFQSRRRSPVTRDPPGMLRLLAPVRWSGRLWSAYHPPRVPRRLRFADRLALAALVTGLGALVLGVCKGLVEIMSDAVVPMVALRLLPLAELVHVGH
jgi:hypothetical protein